MFTTKMQFDSKLVSNKHVCFKICNSPNHPQVIKTIFLEAAFSTQTIKTTAKKLWLKLLKQVCREQAAISLVSPSTSQAATQDHCRPLANHHVALSGDLEPQNPSKILSHRLQEKGPDSPNSKSRNPPNGNSRKSTKHQTGDPRKVSRRGNPPNWKFRKI